MNKHYMHLGIMAFLSFVAMFILMYSMVDQFANVFPNINQFYMAALMAAPMVIIELIVMKDMYKNTAANIAVLAVSLVAIVGFFAAIRYQTAVTDSQFLRSMIPHHGGAVLMCEEAPIEDAEVRNLCKQIISSQKAEIAQMKKILARLQK
jgi:hypothetical protein